MVQTFCASCEKDFKKLSNGKVDFLSIFTVHFNNGATFGPVCSKCATNFRNGKIVMKEIIVNQTDKTKKEVVLTVLETL